MTKKKEVVAADVIRRLQNDLANERARAARLARDIVIYRNVLVAARSFVGHWRDTAPPAMRGREFTLLIETVDWASRTKIPDDMIVDDGVGGAWEKCKPDGCGLHVVRPGKVQCHCDEGDTLDPSALPRSAA